MLRLLASQEATELRDRLALACIQRVHALARSGEPLGDDRALAEALDEIGRLRGLLSHAVAEAAIEARYVIFERPETESRGRAHEQAAPGLARAGGDAAERAARRGAPASGRRAARHLRARRRLARRVRPAAPAHRAGGAPAPRLRARRAGRAGVPAGDRTAGCCAWSCAAAAVVLGAACSSGRSRADAPSGRSRVAEAARESHEWPAVTAIELFAPSDDDEAPDVRALLARRARRRPARRPPDGDAGARRRPRSAPHLRADGERLPRRRGAARHPSRDGRSASTSIACAASSSTRLPAPEALYASTGAAAQSPATSASSCSATCARARPTPAAKRACTCRPSSTSSTRPRARCAASWPSAIRSGACSGTASPSISRPRSSSTRTWRSGSRASSRRRRATSASRRWSCGCTCSTATRLRARRAPREIVISDLTGSNMTIQAREPRRNRSRRRASTSARSSRRAGAGSSTRTRSSACSPARRRRAGSASGAAGRRVRGVRPRGGRARAARDQRRRPPVRAEQLRRSCSASSTRRPRRCPRACSACSCSRIRRAAWARSRRPECDRIVAAIDLAERAARAGRVGAGLERRAHRDGQRHREPRRHRARRAPHRRVHAGGRRHPPDRRRRERRRAELLGRARDDAAAHARRADHDAGRVDGADRPRGARGVGRGLGRGRAGDRRLRAHHGAERRGAVLRDAISPTPTASSTSTTATPTWCRASAGRGRIASARSARARPSPRSPASPGSGFERVGEIFDDAHQPGPQAPVPDARGDARGDRPRRRLPRALARLGRRRDRDRLGRAPRRPAGVPDRHREPEPRARRLPPARTARRSWSGGTLFPLSSKKVARALNAASGNRPGGDPREPVGLRRLAGVDAQAPARVRRGDRARGGQLRRADPVPGGVALPRRRLRRVLARAERRGCAPPRSRAPTRP